MSKTVNAHLYLYGKPSERLIFFGLAKKLGIECNYNESDGYMRYKGSVENVAKIHETFNKICSIAYRKLAFMQADHRFDNVTVSTLNKEFMQAFAAITYSLTTGEQFMFKAETEAQREGIKAGGTSV